MNPNHKYKHHQVNPDHKYKHHQQHSIQVTMAALKDDPFQRHLLSNDLIPVKEMEALSAVPHHLFKTL